VPLKGLDILSNELRRDLKCVGSQRERPKVDRLISREASAYATAGEPSYRGITTDTYVGTDRRAPGTFTLEGNWNSQRQFVELKAGTGRIVLPFTADEVNLVVQPGPSGAAAMMVLLDGQLIGDARGADVERDGVARFDRSGMIRLVAGAPMGKHILTLISSSPGVHAYVFTFDP
jgi:hypothetical protein